MSNPSCLPNEREINESLRNQLKELQKAYERQKRLNIELKEQMNSKDSRHRDEIERNKEYLQFLGWFSNSFI